MFGGFGSGFFGGGFLPMGGSPPSSTPTSPGPPDNSENIPSVPAINYTDNRKIYSQKSKYAWLVYIRGKLVADLTGLAQDRHLILTRNDYDQIDFSVNLDAVEAYAKKLNINTQDIFQAGISEVRLLRYGVVISAGYLTYWDVKLAVDRKLPMKCRGWLDLLNYRFVTTSYVSASALQIVQDLINTTQELSFGDMGFVFGALPPVDDTNVYTDKVYTNKSIYDIIQELCADENGIDIQITWDKQINIYHPGQGIVRKDIVFSYPGNIKDLSISNDATVQANSVIARGSGSGDLQLIKTAVDLVSQEKYGLKQSVVDFPDISDEIQLQNLANAHLALFSIPLILHEVTIDGSQDPQVGSFNLGDQIRISVTQLLKLYAGVNDFFKADKIDVTIGNEEEEDVVVSANKSV